MGFVFIKVLYVNKYVFQLQNKRLASNKRLHTFGNSPSFSTAFIEFESLQIFVRIVKSFVSCLARKRVLRSTVTMFSISGLNNSIMESNIASNLLV